MKYKHLIGIAAGAALCIGVTAVTIGWQGETTSSKYARSKLNQLDKFLQQGYLGDIDDEQLENSIYAGYVSGLEDPKTRYLNEEQLKEQQVLAKGQYIGTGMQFEWGINGRYIIVTDIIQGSPAESAKVQVGDKITQIDEIKVMTSNELELYKKLTYTGEEPVSYTVEDNNGQNERQVSLKSEVIDRKEIDYKLMDNSIGYISLFTIKDATSEALNESIKVLKEKGAKGFIIDIRNAYSNNIEEIYKICKLFIDEKMVFKIKNKQGGFEEYKTQKAAYDEPIVVITNSRTQGSLEAFGAAVKYSKRGLVVGEATAGTGLVSEIIPLEDHTGMMVATGIIYTPDNKSLSGEGVEPDREIKNPIDASIELLTSGEIQSQNDAQLMEAVKQLD
ncbi:MAG: peptidase [Clostridia bacterium]|nr:peptidase [Clostridia bacterium]